MTPDQCRAVRKHLGWSREMLEKRSGVSVSGIEGFERSRHRPRPHTLGALRRAFEAAGVDVADREGASA